MKEKKISLNTMLNDIKNDFEYIKVKESMYFNQDEIQDLFKTNRKIKKGLKND